MSTDDVTPSEQVFAARKIRDRALILPLVGLTLLLPPIATIFELDVRVFGLPFTAVYLFGVWAMLIVGAALLSRHLHQEEADDGEEPETAEPRR